MKNMIKTILCFGLLFIFSPGKIKALEPMYKVELDKEIKIIPTATPTIAVIKPIKEIELDIKPLATKTPTPVVVTQIITATPSPMVTSTESKITETEKISVEIKTEEIEETEVDGKEGEEINNKNSDKWFWVVIVGLLALILIIQVWSTRKSEEGRNKKENP